MNGKNDGDFLHYNSYSVDKLFDVWQRSMKRSSYCSSRLANMNACKNSTLPLHFVKILQFEAKTTYIFELMFFGTKFHLNVDATHLLGTFSSFNELK